MTALAPWPLPAGVRSRTADNGNGLAMHWLEAGFEEPGRPLVLLLHGFPELSFSWRHQLPALAAAGYHVVAPDQRGYGRTRGRDAGWRTDYDGDLRPFRMLNLVRDALGLVHALGHRTVAAVIGHDFGSLVAGWCALVRPDVFPAVVMMSAPFTGPSPLPFDTIARGPQPPSPVTQALDALARLDPPRKHYQRYYATREADADMRHAPQGLHDFTRAYYHVKSGDDASNRPHALAGWTAEALGELPTYYVMNAGRTMAQTVAPGMPDASTIARCGWLPDAMLAVYVDEYARTGYQGGLNWYRCMLDDVMGVEHQLFAGATIDQPSLFIAGAMDWGIHQAPGTLERMSAVFCTDMRAVHLVDGAGHWVQQEKPDAVTALLRAFLDGL